MRLQIGEGIFALQRLAESIALIVSFDSAHSHGVQR